MYKRQEYIYIYIRVLPGTSLEYVGLFQRNQVPAQSHGVGVEVRADGYGCVVPAIGQRKEYLGGNADTSLSTANILSASPSNAKPRSQ